MASSDAHDGVHEQIEHTSLNERIPGFEPEDITGVEAILCFFRKCFDLCKQYWKHLLFIVWLLYLGFAFYLNFTKSWPLGAVTMLFLFVKLFNYFDRKLDGKLTELLEKIIPSVHIFLRRRVPHLALVTRALILISIILWLLVDTSENRLRLMSGLGLVSLLFLAFVLSKDRRQIRWQPVLNGLLLSFVIGILNLRWSVGISIIEKLSSKMAAFLSYTEVGSSFVYGFLVKPPNICGLNPVFAFYVLSTLIFFSSFISVLYFFGILQFIVSRISSLMQLTLGTTAVETLAASSNMFVGHTEAILLIRPYLSTMTLSELHAVMTSGFATVAGTMFNVYISFGACGSHIISASLMSAPTSLAVSKLMYPETQRSKLQQNDAELAVKKTTNVLEAIADGAQAAMSMVINIVAMFIAFFPLLKFLNDACSWCFELVNIQDITFERLASYLFYPISFVLGVGFENSDLMNVSQLLALKSVINEFIAYERMGQFDSQHLLAPRAKLLSTYALCGFSNFGALAIQLAALRSLCPQRKSDFASLGIRALFAANITCLITACLADVVTVVVEGFEVVVGLGFDGVVVEVMLLVDGDVVVVVVLAVDEQTQSDGDEEQREQRHD